MEKIRLMVIDKNMCSIEIEIDKNQFGRLGIDTSKVKQHYKKRSLNNDINMFLESFKGVNENEE